MMCRYLWYQSRSLNFDMWLLERDRLLECDRNCKGVEMERASQRDPTTEESHLACSRRRFLGSSLGIASSTLLLLICLGFIGLTDGESAPPALYCFVGMGTDPSILSSSSKFSLRSHFVGDVREQFL